MWHIKLFANINYAETHSGVALSGSAVQWSLVSVLTQLVRYRGSTPGWAILSPSPNAVSAVMDQESSLHALPRLCLTLQWFLFIFCVVKNHPYRGSENLLIQKGVQDIFWFIVFKMTAQITRSKLTKLNWKRAMGPRNVEKTIKIWPFSCIWGFWIYIH